MLADLWLDFRYALRKLRDTPGVTLIAAGTLAIGIAANTTMFAIADGVLLQPMAARAPGDIVAVFTSTDAKSRYRSSSYPDYLDIRGAAQDVLSDLALYGIATVDLQGERGERVTAATVSGNYFRLLGVGALHGRALTPEDDQPGAPPAVVLNEVLWHERFGGDSSILGKAIRLNRQTYTVVGVLARQYSTIRRFLGVDAFVPVTTRLALTDEHLDNRESRQFFLLGRLRPRVSLAQASARMDVASRALYARDPGVWRTDAGGPATITVVSEAGSRVPPSARLGVIAFLAFLQAMVGVVLVIACANLANLALARALGREQEIAIRTALGSGRRRLIQQLLTESALVAGLGGLAALTLTRGALQALSNLHPRSEVSFALNLTLDARVLGFAVAVTIVTTLLFGLAPALTATRSDVMAVLRGGGGEAPRRVRLRNALIVAEVTLSMVLLIPAGLFVRSVLNLDKVALGFAPHNLAVVSVSLDPARYGPDRGMAAYRRIGEMVRHAPDVMDASFASLVPMSGVVNGEDYREIGSTADPRFVLTNAVDPEYFTTLGIPLVQGRAFTDADGPAGPPVAIVNQAFARTFWPAGTAIGERLVAAAEPHSPIEIVGVVPTGKYASVSETPTPALYRPLAQAYGATAILHIRTRHAPGAQLGHFAAMVQAVDPAMPVFDVQTMDRELALSIGPFETLATLLVILGTVGVALACAGLYGVIAYGTARRRREIAVRMTLGANRGAVLGLFVAQGSRLIALGIALGLPLAGAVALLVSSFLYGVASTDAVTYALVAITLGAVGLTAVFIPAFRATRTPPAEALRG